jgi:hypothetical protein
VARAKGRSSWVPSGVRLAAVTRRPPAGVAGDWTPSHEQLVHDQQSCRDNTTTCSVVASVKKIHTTSRAHDQILSPPPPRRPRRAAKTPFPAEPGASRLRTAGPVPAGRLTIARRFSPGASPPSHRGGTPGAGGRLVPVEGTPSVLSPRGNPQTTTHSPNPEASVHFTARK